MRTVTIGLLGCGTVGQGFVRLLKHERFAHLRIGRILVRDLTKHRPGIDPSLLTTDAIAVIDNCDLVVELIGGVHSAGAYIRRALRDGRDVVTANKALLAEAGSDLWQIAKAAGARIGFDEDEGHTRFEGVYRWLGFVKKSIADEREKCIFEAAEGFLRALGGLVGEKTGAKAGRKWDESGV